MISPADRGRGDQLRRRYKRLDRCLNEIGNCKNFAFGQSRFCAECREPDSIPKRKENFYT